METQISKHTVGAKPPPSTDAWKISHKHWDPRSLGTGLLEAWLWHGPVDLWHVIPLPSFILPLCLLRSLKTEIHVIRVDRIS